MLAVPVLVVGEHALGLFEVADDDLGGRQVLWFGLDFNKVCFRRRSRNTFPFLSPSLPFPFPYTLTLDQGTLFLD